MQGAEVLVRVVAAAGRLSLRGDDRAIDARLGDRLVAEAGDPGVEGGLEGLGLEHHQDATEDVLAGDAVRQVEEARQEILLEPGPAGDGRGPGGTCEDGQDGEDQDARQRVPPVDMGARILQGGEGLHDLVERASGAHHRRPPTTGSRSRHGERYTRSDRRAQDRKVYQIVIKVRASPVSVTGGPLPGSGLVFIAGGAFAAIPMADMTVANNALTGGTNAAASFAHTTTGRSANTFAP